MENANNNNSPTTGANQASPTNPESQQLALSNQTTQRPPTPSSLPPNQGQSHANETSQTSQGSQDSIHSAPIGIHVRTTRGQWRGQHHHPGRSHNKPSTKRGKKGNNKGKGTIAQIPPFNPKSNNKGGTLAVTPPPSSQSKTPPTSKDHSKKNNNKGSTSTPTPNVETKTILNRLENMNISSINQSRDINNLSTQIEGLIDVLRVQLASPSMHQNVNNLSPIDTHGGSDDSQVTNMGHTNDIIDFFRQYPFDISIEYINDFILPLYPTLDDVFLSTTLSLHAVSLIISLNRASKLDDYEELEHDLVTFLGFIQYSKECPEDVTPDSFDIHEYCSYLLDQYLDLREKLVAAVTKMRNICEHNTKANTAKYRARTASASKPKVGFASPVQEGYTDDENHEEEENSGGSPPTFRGILFECWRVKLFENDAIHR